METCINTIVFYNLEKYERLYLMITVMARMNVDFGTEKLISAAELAQIMDIEETSARELLSGAIPFNWHELQNLSAHLGVSLDSLKFSPAK
jgi:hypothetical protein